ncbi:hypothetical protein MOQ_001633 [Trypanosoma cruzi marinkellei]|uniref:CSD domain-containing protein n=1 Tax=Trypanosoma cruzi marinkellei TaxID=85056 RepID=K2NT35_TRYCR|nr:hypothetical protein MOQ_001633 [Trypanosoma cruzi marinkellei]
MFFHPSALRGTYDFGGSQFVALGMTYPQPAPPPVGYTEHPPAEMRLAAPSYHAYPPTPPSFTQGSSTTSYPGGMPAPHVISHARDDKSNTRKGSIQECESNLTSRDTSPGILSGSGWGLTMRSSMSSTVSPMSTPPIYVVLQPSPSQNPRMAAAPGGFVGLPPQATLVASNPPSKENGTRYELGEWYEGVVKRYNPMRGFGFLTATHHLQVISPSIPHRPQPQQPQQQQQQQQQRQKSTTTATKPTVPPTTTAGGVAMELKTLDTKDDIDTEVKAHVVRTPVTVGDIFVHQSYIQMQGFRALSVGDKVVFRIGVLPGKKAHQAVSVQRTQESGKSAAATAPTSKGDVEKPRITEEKPATQQPTASLFHTRQSLEELLQNLAKSNTSDDGEPASELPLSMDSLKAEVRMEDGMEGCSLPTPMFSRNFASFGTTNALDEPETPSYTKAMMDVPDSDEVCDFLTTFGGN